MAWDVSAQERGPSKYLARHNIADCRIPRLLDSVDRAQFTNGIPLLLLSVPSVRLHRTRRVVRGPLETRHKGKDGVRSRGSGDS